MSILSLVDRRQDGLVDPEAHGGGDESQGQVANHTENTSQMMLCFVWLLLRLT